MYSIVLAEGAGESGNGWLVWVALAVFLLMVILGWWVSQKGWLKPEEESVHDSHNHDEHGHEQATHHAEAHAEPATPDNAQAVPSPESTVPAQPDDLTLIEGIGPKVAKLLHGIGITTFQQLADADLGKLREALDGAGYKYMEPAGWKEQAALAAKGDTEGLQKLQETLKGGRKVQ